jgi:hypothetical protein
MALEISGNIELDNGLSLSSMYGRVEPLLSTSGNIVFTNVNYWVSHNDYLQGKSQLSYYLLLKDNFNYDRTTDGSDLLAFSSEKIKEELEAKGFSVQITEL